MQSQKKYLKLQHYSQIKGMMCETAKIQPSKVQEKVILVHAVCTFYQLQCINNEQEKCEFPINWNQSTEGVYKFRYILPSGPHKNKIVQFRLVDTGESLSVNFVLQNEEKLYCVQISLQEKPQDSIEIISKEIDKLLETSSFYSNQNDFQERERPYPLLQPVPLQPVPFGPINDRPMPLDRGPGTIPIGNPFGRQQYVGPNSQIFAGREGQGPRFPTGSNRAPIGARWDPVDPFGEEGPKYTSEFFGFNQWGQPKTDHNPFGKGGFGGKGNFF